MPVVPFRIPHFKQCCAELHRGYQAQHAMTDVHTYERACNSPVTLTLIWSSLSVTPTSSAGSSRVRTPTFYVHQTSECMRNDQIQTRGNVGPISDVVAAVRAVRNQCAGINRFSTTCLYRSRHDPCMAITCVESVKSIHNKSVKSIHNK